MSGLLGLAAAPDTVAAAADFNFYPATANDEPTWLELGGKIYGAKPDQRGPIGGGTGYAKRISDGDFVVRNLDELINALAGVQSGQVIFIPGETEIDLTTRIYIEELEMMVPEGVVIAGERGHNGSKGALLTSDALKTPFIFKIAGPDVRITGLRIQGPNPKRYEDHHTRSFGKGGLGREYYYRFPTSMGIHTEFPRLEVDNCEISAFVRAIALFKGEDHNIHHNHIHHCQYKGLGYGISLAVASALFEFNLFDSNRHSLAGTGSPGCGYVARHNVELGTSLSHCFDMHGGRDRKDGTTIAGTSIEIYNNTFRSTEKAVGIRGVPEEKCVVRNNWITKHPDAKSAVLAEEKTTVFDNIYGERPVKSE
ncbi:right-handed parallel beta-helix repeat-containing protein [Persicitalea jodogahamensis]|nr:right-handed parallel beta-helix repeat-containing protein [Persicitalea jodogahamensis]